MARRTTRRENDGKKMRIKTKLETSPRCLIPSSVASAAAFRARPVQSPSPTSLPTHNRRIIEAQTQTQLRRVCDRIKVNAQQDKRAERQEMMVSLSMNAPLSFISE